MSFQDIQTGPNPSSRRNQSPSQAVAAGIFQINTAVAAFRRLVDGVGTVKDTPEHRQKLSGSGEESVGIDVESQPFIREQKRQEILLLDNEISFNEAMIEEREQGIREVEEQIEQANEIFKDLAVLVHDQGVVIDDIHSNIDASAGATTQARVQLAKASKSVKSKTSWPLKANPLMSGGQFASFTPRIGDGASNIWFHNWSGSGCLSTKVLYVDIQDVDLTLSDVIQDGKYNLQRVFPQFSVNSFHSRLVAWSPPLSDWVVVNVDGSVRGEPKRAGFGGHVRDTVGE
ncbi:hypothetical protein JHK85_053958 [Glycine max]|uniref:Syntaxin-22 n=1 Tax=Glycine soja TaxID=3848 RepID=A0A0B2SP92_GLYSO|nr:hypothetical protein JHK85_053958 [Glycine max]KHN46364.1 Syntaxin-22 [Glycine soja]